MAKSKRLLVWLPSPLGDAIMATPALRAFRRLYQDAHITFLAPAFTEQILSPSSFCDEWLVLPKGFLATVALLKAQTFDAAILLKNSFGAALTARLAAIGQRVGYAREGRTFLLTDKIQPLRKASGDFKPAPMIDYYLKIAEHLGGTADNRKTELTVAPDCINAVQQKLPILHDSEGPLVILVPGGAFGPSKLWPTKRYAQLADKLHETYGARIVVSVAPVKAEIEIAEAVCRQAHAAIFHLGQTPLSGGELKALYSLADAVIANDTGPRHIAIALDRHVVSLFGPNNPQWTQVGHDKEIQIVGKAPCAPCDQPECRRDRHLCMESITVDAVFEAARRFLEIRK